MDFRYVNRFYLGLKSHILTSISISNYNYNKNEYYPVQGYLEAINNNTGNPQIVQILGETESLLFEKSHYLGTRVV